jgi:hypothetical protein
MNRRELLQTGLFYLPATVGGLLIPGCGGSGTSTPNGPPNPPPCPMGSFAKGLSFASKQRLNGISAAPQSPTPSTVTLPSYFNLADTALMAQYGWPQLVPPIGNQGQQGSCVAWGVGYAMSSFLSAISGASSPTSPGGAASPADLYAKLLALEGNPCGNGTLVADALNILIVEGVASLAEVPYSDMGCSVPTSFNAFSVDGYSVLDPTDTNALKQYLYSFSVIPLAIVVYPDFERIAGPVVYTPSDTSCSLGGHCVALVGWDDSRNAFRIMNSWGTSWGDNGFAWIAYDAFPQLVQEAYGAYGGNNLFFHVSSLVSGSVTTTGSVAFASATASGWATPANTSTPFSVALTFVLSGPLNVSSVQIAYTGPGTGNTLALVNQSVQQWAKAMAFAVPLTSTQDAAITSSGIFDFTVTGTSASGERITTTCQATLAILR